MGDVYDLAKRLTEFYKAFDFYDYKDSLEIGETEDDTIQKLALELSENNRYSIASTIRNIELMQIYGGLNTKQMRESDELLSELNELLNRRKEKVVKNTPNNNNAIKNKNTVEHSSTEGGNVMNTFVVDYNDLLFAKMQHEYVVFLDDIKELSTEEAIERSYEKTIKQELVFLCESQELPQEQAKVLFEMENTLDGVYQKWLKKDSGIHEVLKDTLVETAQKELENTENKVEKISVLLVEPNKYPKEIEVENTLKALKKLVGGNIELFSPYEDEISIVCNEEGKITGLPLNRAVYAEPAKTEMEYRELKEVFREAEKNGKHLCGHLVFAQENFDKPYSEFERTYEISSDNKAFKPNMGGYSIYGSSLDGADVCVRLEGYMSAERGGKNGWKLEKCYLVDDKKEMIEIVAGTFFVVGAPSDSENFTSLSNEQKIKYREMFKYPERFSRTSDGKITAKAYYPVVSQDAR